MQYGIDRAAAVAAQSAHLKIYNNPIGTRAAWYVAHMAKLVSVHTFCGTSAWYDLCNAFLPMVRIRAVKPHQNILCKGALFHDDSQRTIDGVSQ
jgi:hypothetical protein